MFETLITDRRGVSEVIGAILVFGLVVLLVGLVQVTAIPQANEDVDFAHNQRVQDDLQGLAADASTAATAGGARTDAVKTGLQYPNRMLFLNPPPVAGSFRVEDGYTLSVSNVQATDPEADDYVDGGLDYSVSRVVYDPAYNEYGAAPTTVYDGFGVYNRHPSDAETVLTPPDFVDGRDVSLVALRGSYSRSAMGVTTVGLFPVSSGDDPLLVESQDGNPVTIQIPTTLSVSHWQTALADEPHVEGVSDGPGDTVEVELDPDVTYRLHGAAVRVGPGSAEPPDPADPAYLTVDSGDGGAVGEGRPHQLTVAVHDAYGNPVSGEDVEASVTDGTLEATTVETDADGTAVFDYDAPDDVTEDTTVTFNASTANDPSAASFDPDQPLNVQAKFVVANDTVVQTDLGNAINPAGNDDVLLEQATIEQSTCQANANCEVSMTLNNTASDEVDIKSVRYNFYSVGSEQGRGGSVSAPQFANFAGSETLELRGPFESTSGPSISGESTKDVSIKFYETESQNNPFVVASGDFFVLSVEYDVGGQTKSAMYFVAPV